jgi:hypothetical protein
MIEEVAWDPELFEQEWIKINEEVIKSLMANSEIEKIKQKVRTQGHIALEDREEFINLVNKIKYDVIYAKYGQPDSKEFEQFEKSWQHWQKLRATSIPKPENMYEDNIHHLLFGSTPDPDNFLRDFDLRKEV